MPHRGTYVPRLILGFLEAITEITRVVTNLTNVIKISIPKNGGHIEKRAAIGQRNKPHIARKNIYMLQCCQINVCMYVCINVKLKLKFAIELQAVYLRGTTAAVLY